MMSCTRRLFFLLIFGNFAFITSPFCNLSLVYVFLIKSLSYVFFNRNYHVFEIVKMRENVDNIECINYYFFSLVMYKTLFKYSHKGKIEKIY